MDNLEAAIKTAALAVLNGTGTYTYARKAEFNLDHDKPAPHIVFFDPTGREKERTEDFNCLFLFGEPNPDNDPREKTHEIRSRMVTLAKQFFVELDKHELLLLGERPKEVVIREFQHRLSGITYQCPITIPLDLQC